VRSRITTHRSAALVPLLIALVAALVAALVVTSCSSSGSGHPSAAVTTSTIDRSAEPTYAKPGPYAVGYTTLQLPDRAVAVWYPADPTAVVGKSKATYNQATPLPDNLKGIVPAKYNTVVTMDAYPAVAADTKHGPYPVVLFSHGAGGYRLVNSALDVGIASWGYVVVSVDYFERGLLAQVTNKTYPKDPTRDPRLMLASLDLVERASANAASLLSGIVDSRHVGAVGHSAGGGTAFDALNDPRVAVAIGWAPVAPTGPPAAKPTMIIGASGDIALTPARLTATYAGFPAPKRRIEIEAGGHNSFSDVCTVIRAGGGLIEFARRNHLVADNLLALGLNGCKSTDIAPAQFWPIVQHFTVAELRSVFGQDPHPVGLGDAMTTAFDTTAFGGVRIKYQHSP
jgi:dienelactone hydrolase